MIAQDAIVIRVGSTHSYGFTSRTYVIREFTPALPGRTLKIVASRPQVRSASGHWTRGAAKKSEAVWSVVDGLMGNEVTLEANLTHREAVARAKQILTDEAEVAFTSAQAGDYTIATSTGVMIAEVERHDAYSPIPGGSHDADDDVFSVNVDFVVTARSRWEAAEKVESLMTGLLWGNGAEVMTSVDFKNVDELSPGEFEWSEAPVPGGCRTPDDDVLICIDCGGAIAKESQDYLCSRCRVKAEPFLSVPNDSKTGDSCEP